MKQKEELGQNLKLQKSKKRRFLTVGSKISRRAFRIFSRLAIPTTRTQVTTSGKPLGTQESRTAMADGGNEEDEGFRSNRVFIGGQFKHRARSLAHGQWSCAVKLAIVRNSQTEIWEK